MSLKPEPGNVHVRAGDRVTDEDTGKKYYLVKPWLFWTTCAFAVISLFTEVIPNVVTKYIPGIINWFVMIYG